MHRDDGDAHIRRLLDQRAQRADVPPAMSPYHHSEYSDSPSLYSHLSPQHGQATAQSPTIHFTHSRPSYDDFSTSHLSSTERFADPSASCLDLTPDDDTSVRLSQYSDGFEDAPADPVDDDSTSRLSAYGPRMRVHSRAPWEVDDSDDAGEVEADGLSIFGGKHPGLAVIRGLGFGSSHKSSSTHKAGDTDSILSPVKSKTSSETTASSTYGGQFHALHSLAQASMSSSSLALVRSSSPHPVPDQLSIPLMKADRDRPPTATSKTESSASAHPLPSPRSAHHRDPSPVSVSPFSAHPPKFNTNVSSSLHSRSSSPVQDSDSVHGYVHPFANPDLLSDPNGNRNSIMTVNEDERADNAVKIHSSSSSTIGASNETVNVSASTSANMMSSASSMLSANGPITPATSTFSMVSYPSIQGEANAFSHRKDTEKERHQKRSRRQTKLGPISSPVYEKAELPTSSPYFLISLEQAQAREKEKLHNQLTSTPMPSSGRSISPSTANANDQGDRRSNEQRDLSLSRTRTQSTGRSPLGRSSAEPNDTFSIASKAPSTNSDAPPRTLKPKRSGFLKLFNGKEKNTVVPPVPSISDVHFEHHQQQPTSRSNPLQTPKLSSHRVPVPSLSSPTRSTYTYDEGMSIESLPVVSSPKRFPAQGLSIQVTVPPPSSFRSPSRTPRGTNREGSEPLSPTFPNPVYAQPPASAPANITQFPPLTLRPVSTIFSNHFADHLIQKDDKYGKTEGEDQGRSSDEQSVFSPLTSAGTETSSQWPSTPGSSVSGLRPRPFRPTAQRVVSDSNVGMNDQSTIITALQEQIISSRKAWQHQIWELEGQVRDLKAELEELKLGGTCETCGRGKPRSEAEPHGVLNRPRARTGTGTRFANGIVQ